jgi:hypothetical protein
MMPAAPLLLGLALVVAGTVASVQPSGAETLRMGVRDDARPFVYRDVDGIYRGFLYDLCRFAADSAGHPEPEHVPVTAANRFKWMSDASAPIDLLCDPTTITLERAARFDFSPIVFVANSTVLRRVSARPIPAETASNLGCETGEAPMVVVVGSVSGTTAEQAIDIALEQSAIGVKGDQAICRITFDDHETGIAALCSDEGSLSFYFGDFDILSAHLEDWNNRSEGCPASFASGFELYEPYALIIGDRLPDFQRRFIRGIYTYFRDGDGGSSFAEHFPDRRMSPALDMLFRLYRIPSEAAHVRN